MFDNPTIIPLTIVLIILMGVTFYQRSFWVTAFLLVTYCMYVGFILLSESKNEAVVFSEKKSISPKIIVIDSTAKHFDNSIKKVIQIPVKSDSVIQMEHEIEKQEIIASSILELNYMQIARNIDSRERTVIDFGTVFPDTVQNLYCMSGIDNRNGGPQELVHLWRYKGVTVAKVTMQIEQSLNWRCWSVVNIDPRKKGTWVVSVADTNGNEFGSTRFHIKQTK